MVIKAARLLTFFFSDDAIQSNRFLPNLTKLSQTKQITREEILEETIFMMMAASETAAITINTILTILGIYSDIQVDHAKILT